MTSNRKAFGFLVTAAATTAMMFGCTSTPTASPQGDAASQGTTLAPHEVLKGDRHLMVAGLPMSFDQIQAELPETLTLAQAERLLVGIDPARVSEKDPAFTLQQYGRRGYYFNRGYYGGFRGGYGNYRYYGYRGYYFPYARYGGYYRRYGYGGYYPFFYGYNNFYYPFYYNNCGGCGYGY